MLNLTDWKRFSLMSGYSKGLPIYAPKGREPLELARLQRRANLRFFLQPWVMWNYARRIIDWSALKEIGFGAQFIRASLLPVR